MTNNLSVDNQIYSDALRPTDVLVDGSTIVHLCGHDIFHALTTPYFADKQIGSILHNLLLRENSAGIDETNAGEMSDVRALKVALGFCESWLLAERAILDKKIVESMLRDNVSVANLQVLLPYFSTVELPSDVKGKAAEEVLSAIDVLGSMSIDGRRELFIAAGSSLPTETQIKDGYHSEILGVLGNSDNGLARALYYFFLAPRLSVTLHIHPQKIGLLDAYGHTVRLIAQQLYGEVHSTLGKKLDLPRREIPLPPLADAIIQRAKDSGLGLISAAASLRDDPGIIELRERVRHLVSIRRERGYLAYRSALEKFCSELAQRLSGESRTGSRVSRRVINFAELPLIGNVFKILGGGQIETPDLAISESKVVGLFSRWASQVRVLQL